MKNPTDNGEPNPQEIEAIKRKHFRLIKCAQSMLPMALEMGDWFIDAHKRIEARKWQQWLAGNFPEISYSLIAGYVRLAKNRQFLETKFQIFNLSEHLDDFDVIPTIPQCVAAIAEENRRKKLAKTDTPIEVETVEVNGAKSKSSAPERPVVFHDNPPLAIKDEAEQAGTPVENQADEPENVFRSKLRELINETQMVAFHIEALIDYAKAARFSPEQIKWHITAATQDEDKGVARMFEGLLLAQKPVRPRLWQLFVKRKLASML
jgi:hypothetical protein